MYTPPLHKGSFARQRPSENFVQAQMQLFKPLNVSVSEQRSETSKTSLFEPQASFDVFSETTAVNRKQAAAQNSCIKRKEQVIYVRSKIAPRPPGTKPAPPLFYSHN